MFLSVSCRYSLSVGGVCSAMYYHVLLTVILCITIPAILSTELAVTYENNIYRIEHADSSNTGKREKLLSSPLYYPVGLSYGILKATTHRNSTQNAQSKVLFVSDTHNGRGSVFGIDLQQGPGPYRVESILKSSSRNHQFVSYDSPSHTLYLSAGALGIEATHLPTDLTKRWAPTPTRVDMVRGDGGKGGVTTIHGITIDHCSRKLFWSESVGNTSSVRQLALSNTSSSALLLQSPHGAAFYQGLHYDHYSASLLVSITDTGNATTSSCSIVSLTVPDSSHDSPAPQQTVLVPHLANCYPFALTADDRYVYWSDHARQAVMRARKSNSSDVVKVFPAPPIKSTIGYHHPGALGLAIIGDDGRDCPSGGIGGSDTNNGAGGSVAGTAGNVNATENDLNNEHVESSVSATSISESSNAAGKENETDSQANRNPIDLSEGVGSNVEGLAVESSEEFPGRADTVSHNRGQHKVGVPVAETTARDQGPTSGATNQTVVPNGVLPVFFLWFSNRNREDLVTIILSMIVVCLMLVAAITALTITVCRYRYSSYCPGSRTSAQRRGFVLHTNDSGINDTDDSSSYDTVTASSTDTASLGFHTEKQPCNGYTKQLQDCSSSSIIIDLSQDIKESAAANNYKQASCGGKSRKKRFGPNKAGIKHLISKSLSANKAGEPCSGTRGNDGVVINIEDCCQMTLCETPCYTSIRKEGRGYTPGGDGEDRRGLLRDDVL